MKRLIFFFFFFAPSYASSPHHVREMTKQFELAVGVATEAGDVPLVCNTLTQLARTLYRAMQPDLSLTQFQNVLKLSSTLKPDHVAPYVNALIEFARVTLNMNVEGASEKASKALEEALADCTSSPSLGPSCELYALALLARGEVRKAAGDFDGAISDLQTALAEEGEGKYRFPLSVVDRTRGMTHLGSAWSEKEGAEETALRLYETASRLRSGLTAAGETHPSVAEVLLDVAAEQFSLKRYDEAARTLERCIPYLGLPEKVLEVQWSWLRKALELANVSEDEAKERYRACKEKRKHTDKTRRKLPAPAKDKKEVEASFLPQPIQPKKSGGGGGKKKGKK